MQDPRIPVTVLTGFLGAGKTSVLNHLLTASHGRRIAVIENEFGEVGIDHHLVERSDEEIVEMNNGCICCTVRGDLIRILLQLATRRDRFEHVLIETTGLADPAPVAQTFFVDQDIAELYRLDGVVTVADCKHLHRHLDTSHEAQQQVAFADTILFSKTDLVGPGEVEDVERRIRRMNAVARFHRIARTNGVSVIDPAVVLDVGGFSLERAQEIKPTFLDPEYPFEWAGVADLAPGDVLELNPVGDPTVDVLVLPAADPLGAAEAGLRRWGRDPQRLAPGGILPIGRQVRITRADQPDGWTIRLGIVAAGRHACIIEHAPDEVRFALRRAGQQLDLISARAFSGHDHEDDVTSVGLTSDRPMDVQRLNDWIGPLLRDRGADLYRSKGVLSIKDCDRRFVFQAVHMLFDGCLDRPWAPDEHRQSQMVFIGRGLDRAALTAGFESCLVDA